MNADGNPLERRCPRLGGPVSFTYCEQCDQDHQPCFKIIDCWWETFDVVRYLKDHLSEEQFNRLSGDTARPKIASLVELIAKAKQNQDE